VACAFNSFCSYSFGSGDWGSSRAACSLLFVKCQKIRGFTGVCCVRRMDVVVIRTGFSFCMFRLPYLRTNLSCGPDYLILLPWSQPCEHVRTVPSMLRGILPDFSLFVCKRTNLHHRLEIWLCPQPQCWFETTRMYLVACVMYG
jgi:hypothetical protein